MGWSSWLAAVLFAKMHQVNLAWLLLYPVNPGRYSNCYRMRSVTESFMAEDATASSSNMTRVGTTTISAVPAITTTGHCPVPEPRNAAASGGANRNPITSKDAPIAASNWLQARFSVALPLHRVSSNHHSDITNAVVNGLAPFLTGVEEGVGLLQVANRTATLSIGSSPTVQSSPSVALALRRGNAVWGRGQALWLSLGDEGSGVSSIAALPIEGSGGSARYDFVFLWADTSSSSFRGCLPEDVGGDISSQKCIDRVHDNEASIGIEGGEVSGSMGMDSALGEKGGHVVGELRPLNEFSAERQQALDEALETVGVDPRELTEAEAFFGTAALKAYNTFVRPRPKQLLKVMQEPIARAALRTAYQVAFLVRRHRADRAEYLRNKDASMTEVERRGLAPHPVVLVCDNVRSAYNVGSIFRSADTARAAEVITCGFTPHPGGPGGDKLRKTAFGSVDAVAHRHFQDPLDAVVSLTDAGAVVYALETTEDASSLFDVEFPLPPPPVGSSKQSDSVGGVAGMGKEIADRGSRLASEALEGRSRKGFLGESEAFELPEGGVVALVLGNEVTGVDERVLGRCERVVEVPVYGLKNSLNVASAGTVVLYEVLRQWAVAGRLAGAEGEVVGLGL